MRDLGTRIGTSQFHNSIPFHSLPTPPTTQKAAILCFKTSDKHIMLLSKPVNFQYFSFIFFRCIRAYYTFISYYAFITGFSENHSIDLIPNKCFLFHPRKDFVEFLRRPDEKQEYVIQWQKVSFISVNFTNTRTKCHSLQKN